MFTQQRRGPSSTAYLHSLPFYSGSVGLHFSLNIIHFYYDIHKFQGCRLQLNSIEKNSNASKFIVSKLESVKFHWISVTLIPRFNSVKFHWQSVNKNGSFSGSVNISYRNLVILNWGSIEDFLINVKNFKLKEPSSSSSSSQKDYFKDMLFLQVLIKKICSLRSHILTARFARSSLRSQEWTCLGRAT